MTIAQENGRFAAPSLPPDVVAMATDRQITANRANAKRSTGPKTAAGKRRSSGNAYRHGLSGSLPDDSLAMAATEAIARAMECGTDSEQQGATAFARSQLELRLIRRVRHDLLAAMEPGSLKPQELRRLGALDRYERLARTKIRRAMRSISKLKLIASRGESP
jgi:hypothetical protein